MAARRARVHLHVTLPPSRPAPAPTLKGTRGGLKDRRGLESLEFRRYWNSVVREFVGDVVSIVGLRCGGWEEVGSFVVKVRRGCGAGSGGCFGVDVLLLLLFKRIWWICWMVISWKVFYSCALYSDHIDCFFCGLILTFKRNLCKLVD